VEVSVSPAPMARALGNTSAGLPTARPLLSPAARTRQEARADKALREANPVQLYLAMLLTPAPEQALLHMRHLADLEC
jgi:hypothetical protein